MKPKYCRYEYGRLSLVMSFAARVYAVAEGSGAVVLSSQVSDVGLPLKGFAYEQTMETVGHYA